MSAQAKSVLELFSFRIQNPVQSLTSQDPSLSTRTESEVSSRKKIRTKLEFLSPRKNKSL